MRMVWRLRNLISLFLVLNSDQLWQLFSPAWTILLPIVICNLDSGITVKYSKTLATGLFLLNLVLFLFPLPEMLWDTCMHVSFIGLRLTRTRLTLINRWDTCTYVSFIGLRLTKTRLTLINRTRLRTKGQSAGYPQAWIEITPKFFQRWAP